MGGRLGGFGEVGWGGVVVVGGGWWVGVGGWGEGVSVGGWVGWEV